MACNDVGATNPDIAGLGVVLSFAIQAGLSFAFSIWYVAIEILTWTPSNLPKETDNAKPGLTKRYMRWVDRVPLPNLSDLWKHPSNLWSYPGDDLNEMDSDRRQDLKLQSSLIERVLSTISDVQTLNGILLLIAAITQNATLSLYQYHIVYDTVNFTGISSAAALAIVLTKPSALAFKFGLVYVFLLLYIIFVILFGLHLHSWDGEKSGHCYKTHYISSSQAWHPNVDYAYLVVTAGFLLGCMGLALSTTNVVLQKILRNLTDPLTRPYRPSIFWTRVLHSFNTMNVLHGGNSLFPVAMANLYKVWRMPRTWVLNLRPDVLADAKHANLKLIIIALIQYPVHVYSLFALRGSNEAYLSGDSENTWGFGQTVALILVASVILECLRAMVEYYILRRERRHPTKDGLGYLLRALYADVEESEDSSTATG
ncbi:hypothetical protein F5Y16DRAFT_401322 [Xylariaceae sp. FL0255]|nr:hypothetical protein F5Y16DRAFT_401322 [Xylariaceae sp. FL0255]